MILPGYYPYSATYLRDKMRRTCRVLLNWAIYGTSAFMAFCMIFGAWQVLSSIFTN
jgi:hypothetical protein